MWHIFVIASVFGFSVWIPSFAVGLNVYVITVGIKKYKSIIKKKRKKA